MPCGLRRPARAAALVGRHLVLARPLGVTVLATVRRRRRALGAPLRRARAGFLLGLRFRARAALARARVATERVGPVVLLVPLPALAVAPVVAPIVVAPIPIPPVVVAVAPGG